jgi:iron complex transport system permease protein
MSSLQNRLSTQRAPIGALCVLLGVLAAAFLLHLGIGSVWIAPGEVIRQLFTPDMETFEGRAVWMLRLPRACGALLAGALLAMVGAAFQALFRNPLAEPYIVGVSSGAAVGGALAIVLGLGAGWTGWLAGLGIVAASTAGGVAALGLVIVLARRRGVLDVQTLLLAGVAIAALLSAMLSLVLLWGGRDTGVVLRWLLGSLAGTGWLKVEVLLVAVLLGGAVLVAQSKRLNVFAVGEETAQRLGVDTRRLKPVVLITGTVMAAVTVGAFGIIGFLGLVAPHIVRRLIGVDWRWSLLGSGLLGGALLLLADILAQRAVPNAEVPVGIVTAVLGAPFLVILLRRDA